MPSLPPFIHLQQILLTIFLDLFLSFIFGFNWRQRNYFLCNNYKTFETRAKSASFVDFFLLKFYSLYSFNMKQLQSLHNSRSAPAILVQARSGIGCATDTASCGIFLYRKKWASTKLTSKSLKNRYYF